MSKETQTSEFRLFVAVDLPEPVRMSVQRVSREFGPHAQILKLVRSDLLHITLRFLGNVAQDRVAIVERAVRYAAQRTTSFTLTLSGPSAFPNDRAPRVLWMGIERDAGYGALEVLASHVDRALATAGFQLTPGRFSPHVTFGRTRDRISSEQRSSIAETLGRMQTLTSAPVSFSVQEVTVVRSELGAGGPRYIPLCHVRLGTQEA